MQIILDFEDWLEENDRATAPAAVHFKKSQ